MRKSHPRVAFVWAMRCQAVPSAPQASAQGDDITGRELRAVKGRAERSRAGRALPAMHHRIDVVGTAVTHDPRSATGAECHVAPHIDDRAAAAARSVVAEAFRRTQLQGVPGADIIRVAQRVLALDTVVVPRSAQPTRV